MFCIYPPIYDLLNISVLAKKAISGVLDSQNVSTYQRDPTRAHPSVEPRRLSHHACLCDARFDREAIAKKNY
jgi:hypothetical protein